MSENLINAGDIPVPDQAAALMVLTCGYTRVTSIRCTKYNGGHGEFAPRGMPPIWQRWLNGHRYYCEVLLENGIEVDEKNNTGRNAVDIARTALTDTNDKLAEVRARCDTENNKDKKDEARISQLAFEIASGGDEGKIGEHDLIPGGKASCCPASSPGSPSLQTFIAEYLVGVTEALCNSY
ncbi:Uu.00g035640.m01.CDS01 [Anthostomella pinea]|uniref:Uu.00g035640.m01.CDS01 n=1 Tax=Anthostomella pinea TaxID=933095 RepID=A0AAI8VAB0_9PEZI|nr:Uu.00g035640.m01.CDS01 [Anthostomella pinea]